MSESRWDEYLQHYRAQNRLEAYQQIRILPRPKTTKWTVAAYGALLLGILTFGTVLIAGLSLPLWCRIVFAGVFILCVAEFYGRLLGIKIVECYQHYASDATRRKCKCVPSCSEYAILCLKKYELIYALRKIRRRLYVTCKGFDYIIDHP